MTDQERLLYIPSRTWKKWRTMAKALMTVSDAPFAEVHALRADPTATRLRSAIHAAEQVAQIADDHTAAIAADLAKMMQHAID